MVASANFLKHLLLLEVKPPRQLAPKLMVSSGKFVAEAIVCHEGTWSYSEKEEIA